MPYKIRCENPDGPRTQSADGSWGEVDTVFSAPFGRRRDAERAMRTWPEDRMYTPVEIVYVPPAPRAGR